MKFSLIWSGDFRAASRIVAEALLSFIPMANLLAFGDLYRFSDRIRRSGQSSLLNWEDWKGLFQDGLKTAIVWMVFFLASPMSSAVEETAVDKFQSIEGRYFEMVGLDADSLSAVHQIGERVSEVCHHYLSRLPETYPQRIFVALRPSKGKEKVDYIVQTRVAGKTRVDFNWGPHLEMETVCRGLTEAFLKRYAYFNYGSNGPKRIKYFPISALASFVYLSLRPDQVVCYFDALQRIGMSDLNAIINSNYDTTIRLSSGREGYLLLDSLRNEGRSQVEITQLIEIGLAGLNGSDYLEHLLQPVLGKEPAMPISSWWQQRMEMYDSINPDQCESMDESMEFVGQLVKFPDSQADGDKFGDLKNLWKFRDELVLREILEGRHGLISLWLSRVNPAYYNTAHSLGLLYEAVLEGKGIHRFYSALTGFLNDYKAARDFHQKVRKALGQQQGGG